VFLKLLGIAMATAIFVAATMGRMALLPAMMQLIGRANRWIPGWLDRIVPRLDPEPAVRSPSDAAQRMSPRRSCCYGSFT
jgi:putative drug exporter of the RND superfamily